MTKADKIYKVKCTYDMSSKNITFGMMPIRWVLKWFFEKWLHFANTVIIDRHSHVIHSDPDMIHINSSPEAPPPRIRILDTRSREVETVRIGDRLTFRIEIPEDSEYLAMNGSIDLHWLI